MFLKYFCCKESLLANIQIGEIKSKENSGCPALEVHIQLTMGSIRQSTDFLYLQPQNEFNRGIGGDRILSNTSTASSQHRGNQINNGGGCDDKEPLPKRLRDVKKERVVLVETNSSLCDNVGVANV